MREHGGEQRIVFVAPARMADLATNASYSAGAVTWLQKPISGESLEAVWSTILGQIPEAPGLEDLDQLYPDRVQIEADAGPLLAPAPLPLPVGSYLPAVNELPPLDALPELSVSAPVQQPKRARGRVFLLLILLAGAGAYAAYVRGFLPV